MFIPRLYIPLPLEVNETIVLDKAVTHYLAQVIRLKPRDKITLFNGEGGEYHGEVVACDKTTTVQLDSFEPINRSSPLRITLGQALARGDRMDLVMQKATELGVHCITPLKSERSLVKLDEDRQEKRHEHWQKIIISACEQSGLNQLPELTGLMKVAAWAQMPFDGLSLMLDPTSEHDIKSLALSMPKSSTASSSSASHPSAIRMAIGSESGWSDLERDVFKQHNFQGIRLGPRILRTETAGLVALSMLQGLWGDLY